MKSPKPIQLLDYKVRNLYSPSKYSRWKIQSTNTIQIRQQSKTWIAKNLNNQTPGLSNTLIALNTLIVLKFDSHTYHHYRVFLNSSSIYTADSFSILSQTKVLILWTFVDAKVISLFSNFLILNLKQNFSAPSKLEIVIESTVL